MRTNLFRLLFFLLAGVMLSACEKPVLSEDEDSGKDNPSKPLKGNLILRVSGFEIIPFDNVTRTKQDLKDVCTSLCFAVYDQSDKKIAYKNQSASDSNFGQVGLELSPGTYQIVAVAHSSSENPSMASPEAIHFTNKTGYSDTFYYYGTVSIGNEVTTVDVTLSRVVSLFQLVTKDVIPNDVKSINVYYEGGSGQLNAKTGYGNGVKSKQSSLFNFTENEVGKPFTFNVYTIPNGETASLKVVITAFTKENGEGLMLEDYGAIIEEVPIVRNKVTRYTGYLFSDPPQGGGGEEPGGDEPGGETPVVDPTSASYVFPLKVETDWGGTIEKTF